MPMIHEYSPIRRSRNWTIMNVQSVLFAMHSVKKLPENKFREFKP